MCYNLSQKFGDIMKKEKFHILLITNNIKEEYNLLGNYDRKSRLIEFYETNKLRSKITINIDNHLLIKENIDYKITLDLDTSKETLGEVFLTKENGSVKLKIKTDTFELSNNKLSMKYTIIDSKEEIIYEIEMGEQNEYY